MITSSMNTDREAAVEAAQVRALPSVFIRENPRPKCFSLRLYLDAARLCCDQPGEFAPQLDRFLKRHFGGCREISVSSTKFLLFGAFPDYFRPVTSASKSINGLPSSTVIFEPANRIPFAW
jgi:hypothetical protein